MSIEDRIESDEEAREEMVPGHVQSADLSQRRRNPVGISEGSDTETISHVEGEEWQSEVGHEEFIDSEPDNSFPVGGRSNFENSVQIHSNSEFGGSFPGTGLRDEKCPQIPSRAVQACNENRPRRDHCRVSRPGCNTRGERMEVVHASSPHVVAVKKRLARAEALVYLGELSSARQVLEGAQLAPGSRERSGLFNLDDSMFLRNLRSARRGSAGGPSGMTVEHLQPLLDHIKDSKLFFQVAETLARAQVPQAVRDSTRLGRFTALQKPGGGVRGIVAGDIIRRLLARTMSQQLMEDVQ